MTNLSIVSLCYLAIPKPKPNSNCQTAMSLDAILMPAAMGPAAAETKSAVADAAESKYLQSLFKQLVALTRKTQALPVDEDFLYGLARSFGLGRKAEWEAGEGRWGQFGRGESGWWVVGGTGGDEGSIWGASQCGKKTADVLTALLQLL